MSLLGSIVVMILSYLIWSVVLPVVVSGLVGAGASEGFIPFLFASIIGGVILVACWELTAFILIELGEPLTEWSWGWPGYIAINYVWA
jgi:hypothetical protein